MCLLYCQQDGYFDAINLFNNYFRMEKIMKMWKKEEDLPRHSLKETKKSSPSFPMAVLNCQKQTYTATV